MVQLRAICRDVVIRSRTLVTQALADGGRDQKATGIRSSWRP